METEQEKLRNECFSMMRNRTLADSNSLIDIFLNFLFEVIQNHQKAVVATQADADAKILMQMMFSKLMHVKKLLEGVGYESAKGKLEPIVDPTILASLVRNIYETVSAFNLIFIRTKTSDEKLILYNLWVVAGLKYRQRFKENARMGESLEKAEAEAKEIEVSIGLIQGSKLYNELSDPNKAKIQDRIKNKEYRILFEGSEVKILNGWQDLCAVLGYKTGFFENIYTYFSLNAHPSNVSVFQFREMFGKNSAAFLELALIDMKFCFSFYSVFIADYLKLFPEIKETFEKQSIKDQIMLNFYNKMMRGEEHNINDAAKHLG